MKLVALLLFVWPLAVAPTRAGAALRVVSLNLCTDQLLVLVAPQDVAGLTPLARNPALSVVAKEAAKLPAVPAVAESVARLHPDLVLAETTGNQLLVALLRRLGFKVVTIADPASFPAIESAITKISGLLGVPARGRALNAKIASILAGIPKPAEPRTAVVWEPRGLAPGPASLPGAVLAAAGYRDVSRGGVLALETLLTQPPDLVVLPDAPGAPSLATNMLQNHLLASLHHRFVPASWLICGTPASARAAALIAR